MRVLISTTPGLGHVLPVLPLAVELSARGHDLRWVLGPDSLETVTDAGIDVTVAGIPVDERQSLLFSRHPELASLAGPERRNVGFSSNFAEIAAPPMLECVAPLIASWSPDVVVHDAAELAAPLAAAAAGIPSVCHGFGEIVPEAAVRRAGDVMAPLWDAAGLAPDAYAGSYRGLYVDIYPPSLRSLDMHHVQNVQLCRPAQAQIATGGTVYVTFGTVWNRVDAHFRSAVLAAASVADDVLVTIGSGGDPEHLGELPGNVRVERFVAQADVLPRCAAVICHGGSGTVLAALAHGVPLVCLPRGADQFANAANVARVGAGSTLVESEVTEPALRVALEHVLGSARPRAAAVAVAAEIAAMPGHDEVASAVESWSRWVGHC